MNQGGGRNLPPSKYASPQGDRDSRGYENRRPNDRGPERGPDRGGDRGFDRSPAAPVKSMEDDIVLPGESLAKYRSRPAPPPPVAPVVEQEPEERQPDFDPTPTRPAMGLPAGGAVRRRFSGSLPHWLLADNETEGEALAADSGGEQTISEAVENASSAAEAPAIEEPAAETVHNGTAALSEEQLGALSAQLVEAKHEETQARAAAEAAAAAAEAEAAISDVDFEEEEEEAEEEAENSAELVSEEEEDEAEAETSEHREPQHVDSSRRKPGKKPSFAATKSTNRPKRFVPKKRSTKRWKLLKTDPRAPQIVAKAKTAQSPQRVQHRKPSSRMT